MYYPGFPHPLLTSVGLANSDRFQVQDKKICTDYRRVHFDSGESFKKMLKIRHHNSLKMGLIYSYLKI